MKNRQPLAPKGEPEKRPGPPYEEVNFIDCSGPDPNHPSGRRTIRVGRPRPPAAPAPDPSPADPSPAGTTPG